MFSKIRSFISRHKQKFVVTGVVIGSAFLLSRYVRKALREWQEKETKEFLDRAKKQQHYESVERACNNAALTLAPKVSDTICQLCDTDVLVKSLKNGNCNRLTTWDELKYLAFTKATLLVYISSILMVTLRVQLNLIGGYMFKESIEESKSLENNLLHHKYLALTAYLFNEGATKLSSLVTEKVKIVLCERSLKEKISIRDIVQIFWAIQTSLSEDPCSPCNHLSDYVIPSTTSTGFSGQQSDCFQNIIGETRDLLESDEIIGLCRSSVSRGFSNFVDKVAEYFIVRDGNEQNHKSTQPVGLHDPFFSSNMPGDEPAIAQIAIPMAKVIPIINGLVKGGETSNIPYTWMQQLVLMDDLKVLGANVYEGFSV